ncbi:YidC family membrane integrase SpoIIIJ [Anaerobacillus isosaccharinicus]|uniref:Membrane protein insertase YidC n=1 Tax=Anaerobacillus isosaccharinicus TaxID=1532552 RepID=A0A1S2MGC8_9BACI|nr:YidC family membrane integrase SpoIIIJ [Anaerobacillus isosaccharinicus]MBA5584212.1 YidC family membrane integrase SpoIIIJ [Anaerobacillus isosaccharinicus]QOY37386.1 YidC family membrane integrase SpoIIIJ [Anaerobacillus isosaccharinicus]
MKKKLWLLAMLLVFVLLAVGCGNLEVPITAENKEGIWESYFVYPLSWFIIEVATFFNESYGLSIIFVTIIIRIVLLPLMIKQTKSSKAMQALQPEMAKLKEKYSAKDQKTQQKLQQETMKLFQEHQVNPLAGCLPIFVQMPILFAFYHAIIRTGEIKTHTFLWFDLGLPDPFYILPLVAGATTYIQQKMMMITDNPQMKALLYIMPVMIIAFAAFFPSALALYWVVGNIFMIVQTYFITGPNVGKANGDAKPGGAKK